jgi:hypothetical protein
MTFIFDALCICNQETVMLEYMNDLCEKNQKIDFLELIQRARIHKFDLLEADCLKR